VPQRVLSRTLLELKSTTEPDGIVYFVFTSVGKGELTGLIVKCKTFKTCNCLDFIDANKGSSYIINIGTGIASYQGSLDMQ
jgi:hypothetical protein